MSSNSKTFFLFEMITGKKKMAYGDNVEDAIQILEMRLTKEEMNLIIKDKFTKIPQKDLQKYVRELG